MFILQNELRYQNFHYSSLFFIYVSLYSKTAAAPPKTSAPKDDPRATAAPVAKRGVSVAVCIWLCVWLLTTTLVAVGKAVLAVPT
jgi:hypothetical protein